jgi:hypothetical protein
MTIGQNIEQLFGKAAALTGALADGTVFMNDGSPEAAIGAILEQHGFEKYGNEIFYDGTTGVQMEMSLFMGPVFEMKLKHMVEDKWQARGQGRKEKITHQPTGGRGAQGGLKIGEMDRDAIIGHSLAAFQRESFMKRSDSSKIQICTGCGTVPIFNPSKKSRININQCTLCNGPPKYVGSTNHNMEILPLTKKQKGRIVTIELPYATNVLLQELASIANIGLRLITTGDTERLRPMETDTKLEEEQAIEEAVKPLVPIQYPEPFEEERFEEELAEATTEAEAEAAASGIGPVTNSASEQVLEGAEAIQKAGIEEGNPALFQEGLQVEAANVVTPVNPGLPVVAPQQQQQQQQPVPVIQSGGAPNDFVVQVSKQDGGMSLTIQQPQQQPQPQQIKTITPAPKNEIMYPSQTQVFPPAYPGQSPTIAIQGGYQPQMNPIISVDTGPEAMAADGFGFAPMRQQGGRRFQRGPLELPPMFQQQQSAGAPIAKFMVNKLG